MEQQLNQQQFESQEDSLNQLNSTGTNSSSTNSPRRRKAPIDIDTALRLQSQASCVQERASNNQQTPSNVTNQIVKQQQQQQFASPTTTSNINQVASNSFIQQNTDNDNLFNQQTIRSNNLSYCVANYNSTGNISVDYIDCLSNNDLVYSSYNANQINPTGPSGNSQTFNQLGGPEMRGIPSCRKHLSRFHRSHRIEPSNNSIAEQQQQQQQQQLQASSSSNDSSLQNNANKINETTKADTNSTATGDDSLLMINGESVQDQQMSVLYPISVNEVKKRTYFIGSVGHDDSLLGHDELYRYFPNGRVSIFVCTWNQNRKRAPANLNELLLPERLVYMPDIYAIGIQEAFSSQQDYLKEWDIELQTTLGPNHVLLHTCSLGTLHLSLFIRRDLIWFCSMPEESVYNSRSAPTNMIKTKGAVSIAFRFFGTSFMFTNCHFPAHENKLKDRIDEYQRIIQSIDLPKNLKLLKPRYLSIDSTARFDCVFFLGDLNFRLEQRTFDETIQILDDIFQSKEKSFEILTQNDELLKVMETQQAFHGFDEHPIRFPPTFKFLAQTNRYDRQTKRVPSYTDRILFRSKRQRHIQCLLYDWLPQLLSSDHKPVYCLFDVLIRPGHEQNTVATLNAGLFQRTIYLEALKRRIEDPDGLRVENGASGNLICSIS